MRFFYGSFFKFSHDNCFNVYFPQCLFSKYTQIIFSVFKQITDSFEHFCLLLKKDYAAINTALNRKTSEELNLVPFDDGKVLTLTAFDDIMARHGLEKLKRLATPTWRPGGSHRPRRRAAGSSPAST